MTRRDQMYKWSCYGLATLLVFFLERCVFGRLPVMGVTPMLIVLTVVMAAAFEGSASGAVFGMAVGGVCVVSFAWASVWIVLAFTLTGLLCGITTQYAISRSLAGCLLCSAGTLAVMDGVRILYWGLLRDASLSAMLQVAGPELLYSLILALPVYLLFSKVYQKVGGTRLM